MCIYNQKVCTELRSRFKECGGASICEHMGDIALDEKSAVVRGTAAAAVGAFTEKVTMFFVAVESSRLKYGQAVNIVHNGRCKCFFGTG